MASKEIEAQVRRWLEKNWVRYVKENPLQPGLTREMATNIMLNEITANDPELVYSIRLLEELGGNPQMLFCIKCLAAIDFNHDPGLPFHTEIEEELVQHLLLVHDLKVVGKDDGGGYEVEPVPKVPKI